jgi:hypothetical protein
MTEFTPPAAVKLIRPAIYAGAAVSILGAALVSGKLELGLTLFWEILVLALGIAILLFGVLAALSWRIAKTAMANEAAGIEPPPYDDDDD